MTLLEILAYVLTLYSIVITIFCFRWRQLANSFENDFKLQRAQTLKAYALRDENEKQIEPTQKSWEIKKIQEIQELS